MADLTDIGKLAGGDVLRSYLEVAHNNDGSTAGAASVISVLDHGAGTLYVNTAGGTSTTLYVKESATDKTGWVAK